MKNSVTRDFIAYDYLSLDVPINKEQLYIDCYQSFGWILVSYNPISTMQDYYINNHNINIEKLVNIKFKRDRKIKNKVKLLTLQRNMEISLKKLNQLERQPELIGIMYSMTIGIIGTIFSIFSILSITANTPLYIPFVLNGIIGIIGLVLPYFVYNKSKIKKQEQNKILIEGQLNHIYDSCEEANNLIN